MELVAFLPEADGRSTWVRRARDVHAQLLQDKGGPDVTSTAEGLIARRAAVLESELCLYQTVANCQRRLLLAIGLEHRARDVTPTLQEFIADIEARKAADASAAAGDADDADLAQAASASHQPNAGNGGENL